MAWGLWCYLLFRMRFVLGDFGGGGDGAQANRIGTGVALQMAVYRQPGHYFPTAIYKDPSLLLIKKSIISPSLAAPTFF